ncbi:protein MOR1-like [Humulus lupulus]|uniref:protein MOR1-like n=1 Tax=Humulus lupulus TaxID=3486 RepID=UPI002B408AFB|nr:protein MOR1-like [Humulus lupulus]
MEKWKEGKPGEARAALRRSVREIGLDVAEQSGEITRSVSGPVLPRKNYGNADIHVERQLMPRVLAGTNGPTECNEALDIISFGSPYILAAIIPIPLIFSFHLLFWLKKSNSYILV